METADVILLSSAVGKLAYAVGLSRATVRNMKQNIGFALLVAALLLAGVLIKTVNLSAGMLVHELSGPAGHCQRRAPVGLPRKMTL